MSLYSLVSDSITTHEQAVIVAINTYNANRLNDFQSELKVARTIRNGSQSGDFQFHEGSFNRARVPVTDDTQCSVSIMISRKITSL